jgi:hypothetical protein
MIEQPLPQGACRAIWALLEKGGARLIGELAEVTGLSENLVLKYFRLLEENNYLRLSGLAGAVSGESIPTFTLINRTGRDAPYVDDNGRFVDPNLPDAQAKSKNGCLTARVRLAAESLKAPFSLEELRNAVTCDESEYPRVTKIFWTMRSCAELVEIKNGWEYRPDKEAKAIRDAIKKGFIGNRFIISDLETFLACAIRPNTLRRVFSELRAEGFQVSHQRQARNGHRIRAYLVEAS